MTERNIFTIVKIANALMTFCAAAVAIAFLVSGLVEYENAKDYVRPRSALKYYLQPAFTLGLRAIPSILILIFLKLRHHKVFWALSIIINLAILLSDYIFIQAFLFMMALGSD